MDPVFYNFLLEPEPEDQAYVAWPYATQERIDLTHLLREVNTARSQIRCHQSAIMTTIKLRSN